MLGHYLAIALRNLHRAPFTALINVATLALGLVAFVAAYAVVSYWSHSDRHFANADRTYVITASLALRDGSISTGNMPQTNDLYQKYMRLEFPEFQAIARANPWSKTASITADGRRARVVPPPGTNTRRWLRRRRSRDPRVAGAPGRPDTRAASCRSGAGTR